jgi:hypothetical protein
MQHSALCRTTWTIGIFMALQLIISTSVSSSHVEPEISFLIYATIIGICASQVNGIFNKYLMLTLSNKYSGMLCFIYVTAIGICALQDNGIFDKYMMLNHLTSTLGYIVRNALLHLCNSYWDFSFAGQWYI